MKNWDVIISGAGIIGVSLALELRERGAEVLVLDRGEPGKESSSAAAGMLSATDPETPQELRELARASAELYPTFIRKIESSSGMRVDFRQGAIALLPKTETAPPEYEPLSPDQLIEHEPALRAGDFGAYRIEAEHSVDPAPLMEAAVGAARATGIVVRGIVAVQQMNPADGQVEVTTAKERIMSRIAVNCQGAWSGAPVRPRKGQMLYLQPQNPLLLRHVVRSPEAYLVPRTSGRILVGATVEDVGYDKSVEPGTIAELHRKAGQIVPELGSASVVASWAGLRPGTPDDLPILGETEKRGVFIASGHFRNGILLAPITAQIMADMVQGKHSQFDLFAFAPSRFVASSSQNR